MTPLNQKLVWFSHGTLRSKAYKLIREGGGGEEEHEGEEEQEKKELKNEDNKN